MLYQYWIDGGINSLKPEEKSNLREYVWWKFSLHFAVDI